MGAYFNNVIIDNRILKENPRFKMVNEANSFTKHLNHYDIHLSEQKEDKIRSNDENRS